MADMDGAGGVVHATLVAQIPDQCLEVPLHLVQVIQQQSPGDRVLGGIDHFCRSQRLRHARGQLCTGQSFLEARSASGAARLE